MDLNLLNVSTSILTMSLVILSSDYNPNFEKLNPCNELF